MHDAAVFGSQENDVLLAVRAAGRSDASFAANACNRMLGVIRGSQDGIEEAEVLDRPREPARVAQDGFPPVKLQWMAEARRIRQVPHDVGGNQLLPLLRVVHQPVKVLLQKGCRNAHDVVSSNARLRRPHA